MSTHQDIGVSNLSSQADGKLERLLVNHPSPAVRQKFAPDVANGTIVIIYHRMAGAAASIVSVNDPRAAGTSPVPRVPALLVDPEQFVRGGKPDDWWTLVLFHESVHERQLRERTIDPVTFELRKQPPSGKLARHLAEQKWYAEREAYQKECAFAAQIGASRLLREIAASANTPQFDAVLLSALIRAETGVEMRACFQKFLRKLRHANPV